MNERFVNIFSDLAVYEDSIGRVFPAKAYRTAVKIFQELDFEIDSADQIKDIRGIGDGIYKKVDEYLKTGTFKRYEEYLNSDIAKCKAIAGIKGFGMNKTQKLFAAGITSLEQLKEITKDLPVGSEIGSSGVNFIKSMKIGLEYEAHTDKTRMTVSQHDEIAEPMLNEIKTWFSVIKADAVGSRRRYDGSPEYTIGDIDIIIQLTDEDFRDEVQKSLEGLLDEVVMSGSTKVSGIKNRRQVDFRIVSSGYGALLLHSTGPFTFNIICRRAAIANGWTLNEYGLFKTDTKELIESDSEEEILNKLGIGWVEPKNRKTFEE